MQNNEAQADLPLNYSCDSEKPLLGLDSLERWRELEEKRRNALFRGDNSELSKLHTDFNTSIESSLDAFLYERGLTLHFSNYDEIRKLYRNASIDKISDTEWYTSPSSRGEIFYNRGANVPTRNLFAQQVIDMQANDTHQDTQEEALAMNERFDNLKTELPEAREKLAKFAAKRQGRLFGDGGEAYTEAKQEYDAKVLELGKIQFSDSRQMFEQMSDEEKTHFSVNVTKYIVDEQQKLREVTNKNLKGTKVGKFVEWMQSGSKKQRVVKGLAIGAAGAVVGAGASFIIAGAGLAAGAGAIAVGTTRLGSFARGYATRDKRGMGDLQDQHKNELQDHLKNENHNLFDTTHQRTETWYEIDSREQQKRRRHAVGKALAIMGVGAVVGEGVHLLAEHVDFHNLFHHNPNHTPSAQDLQNTVDKGTGPRTGSINIPGAKPNTDIPLPSHSPSGPGVDSIGTGKDISGYVPADSTGHSALDYFSGHNGTAEFSTGGAHNFEHWMNGSKGTGYTVKPGDTVWGLSQKYLESHGVKHPTVFQTDAVKDQMLKTFQSKGYVDHRGWLTAGAKVKF